MDLYGNILRPIKAVHVPRNLKPLSTSRLLTMTWLEGAHLLDVAEKDQSFRNKVAENMFRAWYVPFYHFRVIHEGPAQQGIIPFGITVILTFWILGVSVFSAQISSGVL